MKAVFNRAFPDYISAQLRSEFPEFSAMRGVRPLAPWRQVHGPGDWTRLRKSAVRNSSVPAGRRHGNDRGSLRQSTQRSEERRVGKEWVRKCRSRWGEEPATKN